MFSIISFGVKNPGQMSRLVFLNNGEKLPVDFKNFSNVTDIFQERLFYISLIIILRVLGPPEFQEILTRYGQDKSSESHELHLMAFPGTQRPVIMTHKKFLMLAGEHQDILLWFMISRKHDITRILKSRSALIMYRPSGENSYTMKIHFEKNKLAFETRGLDYGIKSSLIQ